MLVTLVVMKWFAVAFAACRHGRSFLDHLDLEAAIDEAEEVYQQQQQVRDGAREAAAARKAEEQRKQLQHSGASQQQQGSQQQNTVLENGHSKRRESVLPGAATETQHSYHSGQPNLSASASPHPTSSDRSASPSPHVTLPDLESTAARDESSPQPGPASGSTSGPQPQQGIKGSSVPGPQPHWADLQAVYIATNAEGAPMNFYVAQDEEQGGRDQLCMLVFQVNYTVFVPHVTLQLVHDVTVADLKWNMLCQCVHYVAQCQQCQTRCQCSAVNSLLLSPVFIQNI